jgi:hypothetical protein
MQSILCASQERVTNSAVLYNLECILGFRVSSEIGLGFKTASNNLCNLTPPPPPSPPGGNCWQSLSPVDHLSEEFCVFLETTDDQGLTQLPTGVVAVLCLLLPNAADDATHGLHHLPLRVCGAVEQQHPAISPLIHQGISTTCFSVFLGMSSSSILPVHQSFTRELFHHIPPCVGLSSSETLPYHHSFIREFRPHSSLCWAVKQRDSAISPLIYQGISTRFCSVCGAVE